MDWDRSYSATWRVYKVNPKTWADGERLEKVDSVSLSRTADGKMLESGSMSLTGDFETGYYRIVMIAEQGNLVERVDIATLLFQETGGSYNYRTDYRDIDGSSVLFPASTTAVVIGEYAPAGVDGARYAADLLRSAINAPVEVEGGYILNDHVVHDLGSSVLEAVWSVLDAGGYIIQIDGRGVVHIKPKPTTPVLVIDNTMVRLMQNGVKYTADESDIPNRYVVVDGIHITIATNESETSPVSVPNRGFCVDRVDKSPKPINGETYGEYANRKLREASVLKESTSYTREYVDGVYVYDIVRSSINGMQGDYRIHSQSVNCDNGITINEKANKETSVW